MTNTNRRQFEPVLLAELPEGGTIDLVHMVEALQRLAAAMKRRPGDAMRELGARLGGRSVNAFLLGKPNEYARPLTDAKVWRAAREARAAGMVWPMPTARTNWATSVTDIYGRRTTKEPIWRDKVEAREALAGVPGLIALLAEHADAAGWVTALDALRVALRADEVAAMLAEFTASASATAAPLAPPSGFDAAELTTEERPPRELVRLLDVLAGVIKTGQPWREAAAEVQQRLWHARWAGAWLLRSGLRAVPVPDDLELCRGYAGGHERLQSNVDKWNAGEPGARWSMAPMRIEEARFRGLVPRPGDDAEGLRLYREEWAELRPIPPLHGPAGVVEYLAHAWTPPGRTRDELSAGLAGSFAMLRTDAERLFPELFEVDAAPRSAEPSRLALVASSTNAPGDAHGAASAADVAACRQRIKAHQPMTKLKRTWPDKPAMLAELLRQYEERMTLPDAESAICEEQIASLWEMKENTVHAYLTEARKARSSGKGARKRA